MPANILIRFIRKNADLKGVSDDRVVIKNVGDSKFNLSYTYCDNKKKVRNTLVLSDVQLFKWLRHTIKLVENDAEPFAAIQLDLPFMPSVLFNVDSLDNVYHAILDAFEFHLNNWTVENSDHEQDVYDDLPPLVPASSPRVRGRHHLFLD